MKQRILTILITITTLLGLPALLFAATPINGLVLQSAANGGTYAFTNLGQVIVSGLSSTGTVSAANLVLNGQSLTNLVNLGVTNVAATNAINPSIVSNTLFVPTNYDAGGAAQAATNSLHAEALTYAGILPFYNPTTHFIFFPPVGGVSQAIQENSATTNPQPVAVTAGIATNFATGAVLLITNSAQTIASFTGNTNNFAGLLVQNFSAGTNASSEIDVVANNGNSGTNLAVLGINGSGFNNPALPPLGANAAYVGGFGTNLTVFTSQGVINYSAGNNLAVTNAQLSASGLALNVGSYSGNGGGLTNIPYTSSVLGTNAYYLRVLTPTGETVYPLYTNADNTAALNAAYTNSGCTLVFPVGVSFPATNTIGTNDNITIDGNGSVLVMSNLTGIGGYICDFSTLTNLHLYTLRTDGQFRQTAGWSFPANLTDPSMSDYWYITTPNGINNAGPTNGRSGFRLNLFGKSIIQGCSAIGCNVAGFYLVNPKDQNSYAYPIADFIGNSAEWDYMGLTMQQSATSNNHNCDFTNNVYARSSGTYTNNVQGGIDFASIRGFRAENCSWGIMGWSFNVHYTDCMLTDDAICFYDGGRGSWVNGGMVHNDGLNCGVGIFCSPTGSQGPMLVTGAQFGSNKLSVYSNGGAVKFANCNFNPTSSPGIIASNFGANTSFIQFLGCTTNSSASGAFYLLDSTLQATNVFVNCTP